MPCQLRVVMLFAVLLTCDRQACLAAEPTTRPALFAALASSRQ